VESAAEAVKQAKADCEAAIDALNAAGPEAEATVKALGIDLSMFSGDTQESAGEVKVQSESDFRYYIGVSTGLLASPPLTGEIASIEAGWYGGHNLAYGFEFGYGEWGHDGMHLNMIGGGFNISFMSTRIAIGLSTGYWHGRGEGKHYAPPLITVSAFGGPFVKLRCWKVCEFTYRGLMGYKQDGIYDDDSSAFVLNNEKKFTWASQLRFGLRFNIH